MSYSGRGYQSGQGGGGAAAPLTNVPLSDEPSNASAGIANFEYDPAENANPDETVTLGDRTYTFVVSVSVDGDVKIGTTGDESINFLRYAINNEFGQPGIDYIVSSANPLVAATYNGPTSLLISARTLGEVGNGILAEASSASLITDFPGETEDGEDGTPGLSGDVRFVSSGVYVCTVDDNTTENQGWRWAALSPAGSNVSPSELDSESEFSGAHASVDLNTPNETESNIYSEALADGHTASLGLAASSTNEAVSAYSSNGIDTSQAILTKDGFRIITDGPEPVASGAFAGMFRFEQGDEGVADAVRVCIKDTDDNYYWKTVTLA